MKAKAISGRMVRFLRAGLVAAIYLIFAVVIVTVLAAFVISPSNPVRLASEPREFSRFLLGLI